MSNSNRSKNQANDKPIISSSFSIIKGSLIHDTYELFRHWDFSINKTANFKRVQQDNLIGAQNSNWLANIIQAVRRRFEPGGRDRPLVEMAQNGLDLGLWKPILLWHLSRGEFLLHRFLTTHLYERFVSGTYQLSTEDVFAFYQSLIAAGHLEPENWTPQTRSRVASGLLRMASDFGLLQGKARKTFSTFNLPETSFLYLLQAMRAAEQSASAAIYSNDWKLFLYSESDVERELVRLHQYRKIGYERAGSVIHLSLPFDSPLEFARGLAHD